MSYSVVELLNQPVVQRAPGVWRRLAKRPVARVCLVYLAALIVTGIVAPIVLPHVASQQAGDLLSAQQGPSGAHPLGTDTLGRDVLERLLVGTRVTMAGVAEALLTVLVLGVPLGLAAGYFGGAIDRAVSWLADLTFSMPAIIVVIVVLTVFEESMAAGMIAFGVLASPGLMRVVRSATLPVREELYVAAARVSGLKQGQIVFRHVLPRIAGPIIVQATLLAATALLVQSGLAFLGLLVKPPAPSWGGMVANGISVIELQPWLIWPPGVAIALTVIVLGLLGDAIRDATTETWQSQPKSNKLRLRAQARAAHANETPASVERGSGQLLSVRGLTISAEAAGSTIQIARDVSFDVWPGETVGLVGESGSGKTMTAMAVLGLLPRGTRVERGCIVYDGENLTAMTSGDLQRVRGKKIAYVSQEPMVGLNPAFRVGQQIAEAIRVHAKCSRRAARTRAIELLRDVRLPDPGAVARRYPHQLSGGMAQRVVIARALAGEPELLIADEPTTALDVTVQAEILDLLRSLSSGRNMAILLITHDWGVVADICSRALVMYAGEMVETAAVRPIMYAPLHPYTEALLAADPHRATSDSDLPTIPGVVPQPGSWPEGCHFAPRCQYASEDCTEHPIAIFEVEEGRSTRCAHYDRMQAWQNR